MRWSTRFRERLVLGQVRHSLEEDERVLAWAHARLPGVRAPGVLLVTERRCLLHVASRDVDDHTSPWPGLAGWRLERTARARARLTLHGDRGEAISELALNSRARARSATRVLAAIADCTEIPCEGTLATDDGRRFGRRAPQLEAAPRRLRDHARRVVVTVVGVLVLVLSLIFASPFVPGPGALTAVAGIAILAREYEWARDVHVWASRQVERFLAWIRTKKAAFAARKQPTEPLDVPEQVREAA